MTRLACAITAISAAVAIVLELPIIAIDADDDLVDDLQLDECERESLSLIIDDQFGIVLDEELWSTPLYRTPSALAEWVIRKSEEAAWEETARLRKSA